MITNLTELQEIVLGMVKEHLEESGKKADKSKRNISLRCRHIDYATEEMLIILQNENISNVIGTISELTHDEFRMNKDDLVIATILHDYYKFDETKDDDHGEMFNKEEIIQRIEQNLKEHYEGKEYEDLTNELNSYNWDMIEWVINRHSNKTEKVFNAKLSLLIAADMLAHYHDNVFAHYKGRKVSRMACNAIAKLQSVNNIIAYKKLCENIFKLTVFAALRCDDGTINVYDVMRTRNKLISLCNERGIKLELQKDCHLKNDEVLDKLFILYQELVKQSNKLTPESKRVANKELFRLLFIIDRSLLTKLFIFECKTSNKIIKKAKENLFIDEFVNSKFKSTKIKEYTRAKKFIELYEMFSFTMNRIFINNNEVYYPTKDDAIFYLLENDTAVTTDYYFENYIVIEGESVIDKKITDLDLLNALKICVLDDLKYEEAGDYVDIVSKFTNKELTNHINIKKLAKKYRATEEKENKERTLNIKRKK